jgi:uncharacterized membrane protein (GlpM family)
MVHSKKSSVVTGAVFMQYLIKIAISGLIIAGVSELAKRSTPLAAVLASLPLVSIVAMIWLYGETRDIQRVTDLSLGIFWAVIPSLTFFLAVPFFLKNGVKFTLAMFLSGCVTFVAYAAYAAVLGRFGIKF